MSKFSVVSTIVEWDYVSPQYFSFYPKNFQFFQLNYNNDKNGSIIITYNKEILLLLPSWLKTIPNNLDQKSETSFRSWCWDMMRNVWFYYKVLSIEFNINEILRRGGGAVEQALAQMFCTFMNMGKILATTPRTSPPPKAYIHFQCFMPYVFNIFRPS